MESILKKIDSNKRITLDSNIRKIFNIKKGDSVKLRLEDDKIIISKVD